MKETRQDSNDCDEFERAAMRVFLGLGMLVALLAILAIGLFIVALLK